MALQSITYDMSVAEALDKLHENRQHLKSITNEIHHYLNNYGNHWFFFSIGKSHYYKCYRSWARVSNHIEHFMRDPKNHYSQLMAVIDHELGKFHPRSFYARKLQELQIIIAKGLLFVNLR